MDQVLEATGATPVGQNQVVLSTNLDSGDYFVNGLKNTPVGSEVTVTVSVADSAWNTIDYGLGALYCLAENGQILSSLPATSASPRTAVGQRRDGALIFYTVDGRISGHSIGATLAQVAERLIELGCVTVLGLDGGGSTTITVTQPDAQAAQTINVPSERRERAVSNKIFLVSDTAPTGKLDHFFLRPADNYVLGGSQVALSVSAVDTSDHPMTHTYTLRTSAGTLNGDTLTTPRKAGDVTVTASGGGKSGKTVVHVISTPDVLEVRSEEMPISSLTLAPGASVRLSASAVYNHLPLYADAGSFTWSTAGGVGSVHEDGTFQALKPGVGSVTVSAGNRSLTIPVTVTRVALREVEDFEEELPGEGVYAALTRAVGGELARYGRAAGRLDYDLTETDQAVWTVREAAAPLGTPYDALTLWINGDGSGNLLSVLCRGADGGETALPVTSLDFTGWQRRMVFLNGASASLLGFQVSLAENGETTSGTVYLDQITATYDGILDDAPPEVSAEMDALEWTFRASVKDTVDGILPAESVVLSYNGQPLAPYAYLYDAETGILRFPLPGPGESQEPTRITVTAKDASGNLARASVDLPPYNTEHRFTDLDGCWAADYIDFLGNQGIAEPYSDGTYRPYENITRLEFAVMLARAAGLDGGQYDYVQLPYLDLDEVPASALPALRALWAENIMRGAAGETGGFYLSPNNGLTRAQAAAMIGRSQNLGYAAGDLRFPDADSIPGYAVSHIQVMVARGILSGFQDGTFRPGNNITRGQMAKILYFLA